MVMLVTKPKQRARPLPLLFAILCCAGLACAGGLAGCVSSTARVADGMRLDIPDEGPEPGPLEEEARRYLLELTEILNTPSEEPQQTVRRVGGYLQEHRDAIRANATALAERIAAMSDGERVYYEERFSAYFAEARTGWNTSFEAFRELHPRAASRVDGLMQHFD
jgi:hypothetical protein